MDISQRCQSCGVPLGHGVFGTNADQSQSYEYCRFCYKRGSFLDPDITLRGMIEKLSQHMVDDLGMPPQNADRQAQELIPKLRRWQTPGTPSRN
jgi:hypothetical protein